MALPSSLNCDKLTPYLLVLPSGRLSSLMALEVIRQISGFGDGLVGRLVMVDAMGMRVAEVGY